MVRVKMNVAPAGGVSTKASARGLPKSARLRKSGNGSLGTAVRSNSIPEFPVMTSCRTIAVPLVAIGLLAATQIGAVAPARGILRQASLFEPVNKNQAPPGNAALFVGVNKFD